MKVDARQVAEAADELLGGGVVAFPTETVYGLGAIATDQSAVEQVYRLKGRPRSNPLIVHVSGQAATRLVSSAWPGEATLLADAFWPGPLSIVVRRGDSIPDIVTAGGSTVCLRCPDHPTALALLEAADAPLVGPSANRSGQVSPTTAEHVRQSFPGLRVLDGGPCRVGIESTVVRIVDGAIEILRPGVLGPDELARATGLRVSHRTELPAGPLQSPGLLSRHYAPTTPSRLARAGKTGDLSGAVVLSQRPASGAKHWIEMPGEATAYAAVLYDALRQADTAHCSEIVIIEPAGPGPRAVWDAIADRLRRACSREAETR